MTERDQADCWFCNDEARSDPPPGGWLIDDGVWRAGHAPASYAIAGSVILEARRHVLDQAAFNATELSTVASVTGRVISAVRSVTGCDRVYQWATMDAYPHFHVWLIPWWDKRASRGPCYLVESIVDGDGCSAEEALATARRLRDLLA